MGALGGSQNPQNQQAAQQLLQLQQSDLKRDQMKYRQLAQQVKPMAKTMPKEAKVIDDVSKVLNRV
jgi:hypothetical protein